MKLLAIITLAIALSLSACSIPAEDTAPPSCSDIVGHQAKFRGTGGVTVGKIVSQDGCLVTLRFPTGAEHQMHVSEIEIVR